MGQTNLTSTICVRFSSYTIHQAGEKKNVLTESDRKYRKCLVQKEISRRKERLFFLKFPSFQIVAIHHGNNSHFWNCLKTDLSLFIFPVLLYGNSIIVVSRIPLPSFAGQSEKRKMSLYSHLSEHLTNERVRRDNAWIWSVTFFGEGYRGQHQWCTPWMRKGTSFPPLRAMKELAREARQVSCSGTEKREAWERCILKAMVISAAAAWTDQGRATDHLSGSSRKGLARSKTQNMCLGRSFGRSTARCTLL